MALACWQAFKELSGMMDVKGIRPSKVIVLLSGLCLLLVAASGRAGEFGPIISLTVIASFVRLLFRRPLGSISDIGATLLAVFYVAYLPAHFILLRQIDAAGIANPLLQPGLGYLLFTVLVISMSDIGAYYVGKKLGKHPLYPEVSPKKTQEGALGGLICGVLTGLGVSLVIGLPLPHVVPLSVLLVVVGQLGDLSESLLKRDAGLKDSGALLAGHGGLLDRGDSYIFSGVVSYYYIHWIVLQRGLYQDLMQFVSG